LVFVPESGPYGSWVAADGDRIVCVPDDPECPATDVLRNAKPQPLSSKCVSKMIYVIGFQQHDPAKAELITKSGLRGVAADECPGCLYELMARGVYAGSLIHSPNVYDYPAGLHLARVCGGDSLWVHNQQPVNFDTLWM